MDVIIENLLPILLAAVPMLVCLVIEKLSKKKRLWGGITLGLNVVLICVLLLCGAGTAQILLVLLVPLLVSLL